MPKLLINFLLFISVIGAGIIGARYIISQQNPLEHEEKTMIPRPVETIMVSEDFYTPTVTAYGTVEPAITYEGKAQVSGKISYIHPSLKVGGSISRDTVVLEINPEDYKTSLAQSNADLIASKSQLTQLRQEEKNTKESLKVAMETLRTEQQNRKNVKRKAAPINKNTQLIRRNIELNKQDITITRKNLQLAKYDLPLAQRSLALANQELARLKPLRAKLYITINELDAQHSVVLQQQQQVSQKQQQILQLEQSILKQQQNVVQLEQQLTQQDQSVAGQDQSEAQQQQQILQYQKIVTDLKGQLNTYQSRRANVQAQIQRAEQQVKGQQTTLSRTKIVMPFDARISAASLDKGEYVGVGNVLFEAINNGGVEIRAELPLQDVASLATSLSGQALDFTTSNATALLDRLGLSARVRLVGSRGDFHRGEVIRLSESVDPLKRTLGIVIAVNNPWGSGIVDERPPLLKGMYVQIDIMAPKLEAIVIPRNTVHQSRVYVLSEDNRLVIREVGIKARDSRQVVIADGLEEGEQLIVSNLVPIIPGMPLVRSEDLQ